MRRYTLLIGVLLLATALGACTASGAMPGPHSSSPAPADTDFDTTRISDGGLFQVTYIPALNPIPINDLHEWTLHVETADGAPVEDAVITVSGGMPGHKSHGMPTAPQVTESLGNGDYRVEGMQFQMGGWWTITFTIDAAGQRDSITFNLKL